MIKEDYIQWGTPACLVFLCTFPIHLKPDHHCFWEVLTVQDFKRLSNINVLKKQNNGRFLYYGRELADWPVEWSGGWLDLHHDSAAATPSHHCQMSSVYKRGSCVMTRGDVRLKHIQKCSRIWLSIYEQCSYLCTVYMYLTGSRRSSNISHAFSRSSGDNNWKCTKETCLF